MTPAAELAYTFGDVLQKTGAARGQLAHWTRLGLIVPQVRRSSGTGDARLYSAYNLLQCRVGVLLASFRMPAPVLGKVIGKPLRQAYDNRDEYLVVLPKHTYSVKADEFAAVVAVPHAAVASRDHKHEFADFEIMTVLDLAAIRHALDV